MTGDIFFDIVVSALFIPVFVWVVRRYLQAREREKQKSEEQKTKERRAKSIQDARNLGAIFILMGMGFSIGAATLGNDMPFATKAIVIVFGWVIILCANYEARKRGEK